MQASCESVDIFSEHDSVEFFDVVLVCVGKASRSGVSAL